jgi:predicted amidohydrolase
MQDLRVTLVQADQKWENKIANFENYNRLLDGLDTDLIVFPEMFQTGFSMNTAEMSEDINSSKSIEWLKKLALEKNCAVYTSLMINRDGKVYNEGVFVQPDQPISHYSKRKTFGLAGESEHFASGNDETIVDYKGWNIQLQICYDLRFPEIVRNRLLPNQSPAYDVILYVANWPEKRSVHWNTLLCARAIENQSYVIGVNRVGKDEKGLIYRGDSKLVNALGEEQKLEPKEECVKSFVLNKQELMNTRESLPFLKDI